MKNLNLSIPNPCSKNWSKFATTSNGALCSSCSTEVVDGTKMSDAEMFQYLNKAGEEKCARFRLDQLKIYSNSIPISPGVKLLKTGLLILFLGLVSTQGISQIPININNSETISKIDETVNIEHIIRGIIKSEEGELMPGVNIYLKDSKEGTVSNELGEFQFPRALNTGEVLLFSFIGFETVAYRIPETPEALIEIQMIYDTQIILGKVAADEVYAEKHIGLQNFWKKIQEVF